MVHNIIKRFRESREISGHKGQEIVIEISAWAQEHYHENLDKQDPKTLETLLWDWARLR